MAHVYWPNQDPLGKRLILSDFDPHMSWVIKGVTKDIRFFGPDNKVGPQVYLPFRLLPSRGFYLIVRTSHNPEGIHSSLRTEIWKIDKDVSAEVFVPMEQMISDVVSHPRFNLFLLSVFAVAALFLAGVGIYGIVSYNISHRRGEIAIRIALGAQHKQVLKMVAGQGLRATLYWNYCRGGNVAGIQPHLKEPTL